MRLLASCIAVSLMAGGWVQAQTKTIAGHWEGFVVREPKQWSVVLDLFAENESISGTADFPDFGVFQLKATATVNDDQVEIKVEERSSSVEFRGSIIDDEMTGTWRGLDIEAEFKLRRQVTQPAQKVVEEEVQFTQDDATLAGTLILPASGGPHPAIVFTHGSGNQTRSETFYRSRGYLFAKNGIAALIYDRRGKGQSVGGGENAIWNNLADDAIAGVQLLRSRPDIDPAHVGIAGFSQGGWVCPLAASRSNDIAFVLVGSAAAITPEQQNDFNVEAVLRSKTVPEGLLSDVMQLRSRISAFQHSGTGDKTPLEAEVQKFKSYAWFKNALLPETIEPYDSESKTYITFDPQPAWQSVKVPVMAIWGADDVNVPAEKSRQIIESALQQSGNDKFTLKIFPNAGHGLRVRQSPDDPWDFPRMAPGYLQMMVDWVKSVAVQKDKNSN